MGMKEKEEKVKWKMFWKNVSIFGMLWRVAAGAALIAAASKSTEDRSRATVLGLAGLFVVFEGLLRWCSLRGLFKRPTRRAFLRHYPEIVE